MIPMRPPVQWRSHLCFCDGVHCRCHHRCFQLDGTCQRCAQINHIRCYVRFCRNQQNVIKRQPLFSEFFTKFCCHNDPPFNHICLSLCPAFVRMRGQALKKSMHRKCFGKAPRYNWLLYLSYSFFAPLSSFSTAEDANLHWFYNFRNVLLHIERMNMR